MNKDAIIKLVNEQMWAKTDADVPSFKAGDTITVSYKICLLYTSPSPRDP